MDVNISLANLFIKGLTVEPKHEKLQKKIRAELSRLQREIHAVQKRINSVMIGLEYLRLS